MRVISANDPDFMRFWAAYPKRVAKKDARKAWTQLQPSGEQVDRMLEALTWQVSQPEWRERQYVPYPATWLRAERWEDERPDTRTKPWTCRHVDRCANREMCASATILGRPQIGDGESA